MTVVNFPKDPPLPHDEPFEPTDADDPRAAPTSEQAPKPAVFALLNTAEIFAELAPPSYVVDQIVRRASLTEIVAYGSSGKSWMAIDMLVSVASGTPWLERFECKAGRAVYLDYENGTYEMRRRIQAVANARRVKPEHLALASMPAVYMSDSNKFAAAVKPLAETAAVVIIDTLRAASPTVDENDSRIRIGLDGARRIAEQTGCAFVILIHAKKTSGNLTAIDAREAGRGSSAIFDAADAVFHVTYAQDKPLAVQQTKARLGMGTAPFTVQIEDVAGGVRVWATEAHADPAADVTARFNRHCDEVLECLRQFPGASKRLLCEKLHKHFRTASAALEMLERHGAATSTGSGQLERWFAVDRPQGGVDAN